MILRKLAEAIREQNWFTVVLEIFIVVVGIFIGLQVDDWNEARSDRVEESQYLERLYGDLTISVEEIEDIISVIKTRFANGQATLEALRRGELGTLTRDEFKLGLLDASRTNLRMPRFSTMDELIATGRLRIIQDENIKAGISRLKAVAVDRQKAITQITNQSHDLTLQVFASMLRFRPPGGGLLDVEFDLDQLMADKEFHNIFAATLNILYVTGLWHGDLVEEVIILRDLVGSEIEGRTAP